MELKNKGIEFPMTDLDSMPPIQTPARVRDLNPILCCNSVKYQRPLGLSFTVTVWEGFSCTLGWGELSNYQMKLKPCGRLQAIMFE